MALTSSEKATKKELQKRLFVKDPHVGRSIEGNTLSMMPEFLRLAAHSHISFFHYTSLQSLEGMLTNKSLLLTNVASLNDLREGDNNAFEEADRTYVASFGWSNRESIAMWWMYGLAGRVEATQRVPVRLAFNGDAVRSSLDMLADEKRKMDWKVDLFDILYKSSESDTEETVSFSWYRNTLKCSKSAAQNTAKAFSGFVKDGGWDYEQETRISIKLPKCVGQTIFIPFGEALKSVQVLVGPGQNASEYRNIAINRLAKWNMGTKFSFYKVRFPDGKHSDGERIRE